MLHTTGSSLLFYKFSLAIYQTKLKQVEIGIINDTDQENANRITLS